MSTRADEATHAIAAIREYWGKDYPIIDRGARTLADIYRQEFPEMPDAMISRVIRTASELSWEAVVTLVSTGILEGLDQIRDVAMQCASSDCLAAARFDASAADCAPGWVLPIW
jgi:hypothetical protein